MVKNMKSDKKINAIGKESKKSGLYPKSVSAVFGLHILELYK